ncbi:hypothetical protein Esti_005268 [Eimeria stiedai]
MEPVGCSAAEAAGLNMKFLVVTGGTMSGLGKGTTISSIGVLLKAQGLRISAIKIDPYLNADAGTMSPYEHGECYVLDDGAEVDLDLGNYERFLDVKLCGSHNITSGKVYRQVIAGEREGLYLGKTVQMVPHVTDAIQRWLLTVAPLPVDSSNNLPDLCLIEVGGTVGDIESAVYLEAIQQLSRRVGKENFCLAHVSYVPFVGEQKTKPTQHGVKLPLLCMELKEDCCLAFLLFYFSNVPAFPLLSLIQLPVSLPPSLFVTFCLSRALPAAIFMKLADVSLPLEELRGAGLAPDFLFCRSELPLSEAARQKVSLFAQVAPQDVFSVHNCSNIYQVPLLLDAQGLSARLMERLGFSEESLAPRGQPPVSLERWGLMAGRLSLKPKGSAGATSIGIVGKYTGLADSYLSVLKALEHAAMEAGQSLAVAWIESSSLEDATGEAYAAAWEALRQVDGVVCPGGFGDRGIWGKALSARHCRETKKPFLGICLGMQTAAIELARSELGLEDADSEEFNPNTSHPVVISMPEHTTGQKGGSMRLGKRATIIRDRNSLAAKLYDLEPVVDERHRHRFEINPAYLQQLEAKGLKFVGQDERGQRMEIAELQGHPFFICTQYHPELTSRPLKPSPLFLGLVLAAAGKLNERLEANGGCLKSGSFYT